jgi:hypothetical protein
MTKTTNPRAEYDNLSRMTMTALQGIWRRMDIGPASDRPRDRQSIVDDIMSTMFGDDWQAALFSDGPCRRDNRHGEPCGKQDSYCGDCAEMAAR